MEAAVTWPEDLREVEDEVAYLTQNIKGPELLTVGVGTVEFQVRRGADVKEIRRAQLMKLRARFEANRRSGRDRRHFQRIDDLERRSV